MKLLKLAFSSILILSAASAHAVTLDQKGTLPAPPVECGKTSLQSTGDPYNGGYKLEGICIDVNTFEAYYWEGAGQYSKNPVYEEGEAKEQVKVYADAAKTVELGELATVAKCTDNPFLNIGVSCTLQAFYNNTGADVLNYGVPLMRGMAAGGSGTGQSQDALTANQQDDLSDWDPYAGQQDAKVKIISPNGTIPKNGYIDLKLAALGSLPPNSVIQFEWAQIKPPKDPSLGKEDFVLFQPSPSLNGMAWSMNPSKIQVANMFPPGKYALRAQVDDDVKDDWTVWSRFQVAGTIDVITASKMDIPSMKSKDTAKMAPASGFGAAARKIKGLTSDTNARPGDVSTTDPASKNNDTTKGQLKLVKLPRATLPPPPKPVKRQKLAETAQNRQGEVSANDIQVATVNPTLRPVKFKVEPTVQGAAVPGKEFTVQVKLTNQGQAHSALEARMRASCSRGCQIVPGSQFNMDNIKGGGNKTLDVKLKVVTAGKYTLHLDTGLGPQPFAINVRALKVNKEEMKVLQKTNTGQQINQNAASKLVPNALGQ